MPIVSVIVAVHRMSRAAPRTLKSLTSDYQQGVKERDFDVLVVENPSDDCLPEGAANIAPNFSYRLASEPHLSPARMLNEGARAARGDIVLILVDGARILSPGVLRNVIDAFRLHPKPVVAFHSFHLGSEPQQVAVPAGRHNETIEDEVLAAANWPANGYNLLSCSVFASTSSGGWFSPMAESNCLALPKQSFLEVGGFDERFDSPGGGFVNLEFYERVLGLPEHQVFYVLGEGSFHQVHGGASTNAMVSPIPDFRTEYEKLKGRAWIRPPTPKARFLGSLPAAGIEKLALSVKRWHQAKQTNEPSKVSRQLLAAERRGAAVVPGEVLVRPIVFVHGMHRSGTSALARGFADIGYYIPPPAIGRSLSNLDGHFESFLVTMLNERVLRSLGSSWHHVAELPAGWRKRKNLAKHKQSIVGILKDSRAFAVRPADTDTNTPILIKDPRICRLWPLWEEALHPFAGKVHHLMILRSPGAVASSLQRRSGTSHHHGLLLWLRYVYDFYRNFSATPFGTVRYETLLSPQAGSAIEQALAEAELTGVKDPVRLLQHFSRQSSQTNPVEEGAFQQFYDGVWSAQDRLPTLDLMGRRLTAIKKSCGPYLSYLETEHML